MTPSSSLFLAAALLAFASTAFSDDSPSAPPVKSPEQRMQACLAKQHKQNPNLSTDDLKKQCAQILQSQDNHPSVQATQSPPSP